ncbi:MAG: hypothetical protein IT343_11435 [Candidatus Melainabacteria bacterium]|jgi:hypothetical protein|nr:hypothetical protein [Candidatus Melainabacteria bacterium]
MFAQVTTNQKAASQALPFEERVEIPVLNGFVITILAGTLVGAMATFFVLAQVMPVATLAGAMMAGAAVGASAGLLLYGLFDVLAYGRLEEGAEIVEDAEAEHSFEVNEALGAEDTDFALAKAS